jgi:hypothetical protein
MTNMPQRDDETVGQWRERALQEATAADNVARPYIVLGTEHPTDGPVSPEHAAASERWRQAQQDLELANEAAERERGVW